MANPVKPPLAGPKDDLVGDFLDESSELLARLNENLRRLELCDALCRGRLIDDMFRSAHGIKGLSGMLGLTAVNHLTHEMESVLDDLRREPRVIDGQCIESLFETCQRLVTMVDDLRQARNIVPSRRQFVTGETQRAPIGCLFARFQQVVADIARGSGKEIGLLTVGDAIDVDVRLVDDLAGPLVHLVRNAADHGIETPDERQAAGKPRRGILILRAVVRRGQILVQVCDDGRGLDADRIRAKAVEMGVCTADEVELMLDAAVYSLVWRAGLTTADSVSELSGRGVGLDIVRSQVEALGGVVEIESTPGAGATFTIRLPYAGSGR